MKLEDISIHAWLQEHNIKTESGKPISFKDHPFLFDIYSDESPKQVGLKPAQVGYSTFAILKSFWIAKKRGLDVIYTMPTATDVSDFAGGKINRLINQNPILRKWIKEKDNVKQKSVGDSIIYYRGTWNERQAQSHTSDLNIHDEVDTSDLSVIEFYQTRLQHSDYQWQWFFSHPSTTGFGIDKYWQKSDMKHWFIKCPHCKKRQYMSFPESVDMERGIFVCKKCDREIDDDTRRKGEWIQKYKNKEYSGYWISLLFAPWVSAEDIITYYKEKPEDYFYNKVLGLPYIGGGNKLTWELFSKNLTGKGYTPKEDERIVIGVDTGLKLDYVAGGHDGLFYHGEAKDYKELDRMMKRWDKAIAVVDAGGDLIGSRKFAERWQGRVYLCYLRNDRKTNELFDWGEREVKVDRNRAIQLVVDEFRDERIEVHGTEDDWHDYWLDWNNLTRQKEHDTKTGEFKGYKWIRSDRDHQALATVFWRVGMDRFGRGETAFVGEDNKPNYQVAPPIVNETQPSIGRDGRDIVGQTFKHLGKNEDEYDWRDV